MSSNILVQLIADETNYTDLECGSTKLVIGRNEQTKIKSTRCAREQGSIEQLLMIFTWNSSFLVSIDIENDQVYIEQLAANSSYLNQIPLKRHVRQILNDGDKLHLLENELGYTIRIRRENDSTKRSTLKRQNTDEEERSVKKQAVESDEDEEENRSTWIQQQLAALQANANQS